MAGWSSCQGHTARLWAARGAGTFALRGGCDGNFTVGGKPDTRRRCRELRTGMRSVLVVMRWPSLGVR
eukprot:364218-Chlamydomonas_euryale.AAC.19